MSSATLDENLLPILEKATERVIIQSKEGQVLGYFQPANREGYARDSPYSEEFIREVLKNKHNGMPLADFLKQLGAR
jgi:hypothetical protein